jgi:hypothetical protein
MLEAEAIAVTLDEAGSAPDVVPGGQTAGAGMSSSSVSTPAVSLPSMCTGSATMLAYHGNPADLCAALRPGN